MTFSKAWGFFYRYNLDIFVIYCILVFIFFIPVRDHIIGCADSYNQFFPLRFFYSESLKSGEFPLWYPYQALGLPFLGIVQSGALYPINLIFYSFFDPFWAYNFIIFLHFVMAQFFAFLYAKYVFQNSGLFTGKEETSLRIFSFLSGFLFGLSGFIVSHTDFVPLQNSIPYLPLSLLFLTLINDNWEKSLLDSLRKNFVWILGLSISLSYQFLAGYPQAFLYTFISLLIFVVIRRRIWFAFLLSLVLTLPLIFLSAFEVLSLSAISIRNYINFSTYNQGSLPLYALFNKIVPFIFGGSVSNVGYYGPQTGTISFEFISYLGFWALPLTVFAYKKVLSDRKLRGDFSFLIILGIISFILALGKYNLFVHYLLFDFPFYSKVRVFARHLMELNLVESIFISLGIFYILKSLRQFISFLKVSFYTFVFLFVTSFWFFINPDVSKKLSKLTVNSYDLYFPLFFGLLFLFVVVIYYVFKLNRNVVVVFLFLVLFFESVYVFYNISPSYVSGWWGEKKNIDSYLLNIRSFDKNYRVCYFSGFPLLFSGVSGNRMLNYYEPVIPFDFVYFFNIWMNGSFIKPFDYFFILNNSVLSTFSVKYICVNNDFKNEIDKFVSLYNLRSYPDLDSEIQRFTFQVEEIIRSSQNIGINLPSKSITLRSNSRLSVYFRNKVFNKAMLVCFRGKVSKMSFLERYRKIFYDKSEGLGIEIKKADQTLGYFFIDDYYLEKNDYCFAPFIVNLSSEEDFVSLSLHIYPINSFSRSYEISNLEIYSFPLAVKDLIFSSKKPYLYVKSFLDYDVYDNSFALPIVFSPEKVEFVNTLGEVKHKFLTLNLEDSVCVFFKDKEKVSNIRAAKVKVLDKGANYVEVFFDSPSKSLIVFNDMYYRGWKAISNGKSLDIFRVNGLSKGVVVQGKGILRFYYEPFPIFLLYLNVVFIYGYLILFCLTTLLKFSKRGI